MPDAQLQQVQLLRAGIRHGAIRGYFLKRGNTEQEWRAVSADPRKFNLIWRQMLRLPPGDEPPPEPFRR
ncbi:MAG: hypothetical protein M8364_08135 [Methylobacter sp.]|uniref:hypothetical protein n=1 Tax=Methylobacter sp. TaxID=2051955 RepID=UPI002590B4F6|nr:hypothetical protein [Methylobacter sp.]MCL7420855.1 hypothetical protein [Methylobacter sp.]